MSASGYRIADEPTPSGLSHLAVSPLWCLFAVMFGGVWVSWPWFLVNAKAIGGPDFGKDLAWMIAGLVGVVGLTFVGLLLGAETFRYWVVGLVVVKLVVSYRLFNSQSRTFQLFEHFGGTARSGLVVVVAGYLLRDYVLPEPTNVLKLIIMLVLS